MKLEELTALYSPLDIEYSQAMSGPYEDLSFRCDEVTVIAGLKGNRISGFWRPVVAVGDDKLQKLQIERLYDICRNIYYMDFLIDGKLSVISQFLLRHGYKARPYYTQIIDLTKTEEELHVDIRKSYMSLINKNEGTNLASPLRYKQFHFAQSRQTRPNKTWEIQEKMFPDNTYCILDENSDGKVKAGGMFYYNQHCVYYFSGKGNNSHAVIWDAIRHAKGRNRKTFETGEQVFSGDEKLVNISKFKRGFGGETKTRLILEKEQ